MRLNLDRLGGGTFDFTIKAGKNVFDVRHDDGGSGRTRVSGGVGERRGTRRRYSKEIIKENRRRRSGRE